MLHHIYNAYVFWRNCFFDIGLLRRQRVHLPVISIGNIVAGGTGKTSLVYKIASDLNIPVGILSRGYAAPVKVQSKQVTSAEEGDEAYMLSQKLPFARVVVGKNRVKSAKTLTDVQYILLDDGMQHRYIQRDIEIVMVHAENPLGGGYYLPKGTLRDSPKRLKQADWIFVQGGICDLGELTDAPIIGTRYKVENQDEFAGRKIAAFCGIGTPDPFYQMLKEIDCEIVLQKTLPDHALFKEVDAFISEAKAKGAERIVCTEKDFVKLKNKSVRPLMVSLEITYGKERYQQLLNEIQKIVSSE